jgi:hypothetical protein
MRPLEALFTPILKAVGAVANNGGLFKKRKKQPFNPKITFGFNFMPSI